MSTRFCRPRTDVDPTRFLYVSGIGAGLGTDKAVVEQIFGKFGSLDSPGVEMVDDKRFCFVIYQSLPDAINAKHSLEDQKIEELDGVKVMIKFAAEYKHHGPPEPEECVSVFDAHISGLTVVTDFLSNEEEDSIWIGLGREDHTAWRHTLNRRVQHYGFTFNYRTLLLDYSSDTPPIPADITPLLSRLQHAIGNAEVEEGEVAPGVYPMNQLTMNEYMPGQGIAAHADTTACFGPTICILSLGSDIGMTFAKLKETTDGPSSSQNEESNVSSVSDSGGQSVQVMLPRRSLLLLRGHARYRYTHGIASRNTDKYRGAVVERGRRVSMTFRQAIVPGPTPGPALLPLPLETAHVYEVYDAIAVHWNHTRGKRKVHWHSVKSFLEGLPAGSLLADIGCGDGKYFGVNPDVTVVGCDRSFRLLEVTRDPAFDVFCCDAAQLPLCSDVFDAVICVAVMHHISTLDRRVALLRELVRVCRPGGVILVQAWAREQEGVQGRSFDFQKGDSQDVLVPWTLPHRFEEESSNSISTTNEGCHASAQPLLPSVARGPAPPRELSEAKAEALRLEELRRRRGEEKRRKARERVHKRNEIDLMGTKGFTERDRSTQDCNEVSGEAYGGSHDTNTDYCTSVSTFIDAPTETTYSSSRQSNVFEEGTTKPADICQRSDSHSPPPSTYHQPHRVLQRYCHVYKEGELEDLCSSVPHCRLLSSGYDKGNWFVRLLRIDDPRLAGAYVGPPAPLPTIVPRKVLNRGRQIIDVAVAQASIHSAVD